MQWVGATCSMLQSSSCSQYPPKENRNCPRTSNAEWIYGLRWVFKKIFLTKRTEVWGSETYQACLGKLYLNFFFPVHWNMRACMLSHFSHIWLFATLWTATHQAPLSMRFSRKSTRVGCHALLLQRNLPDPGMEPASLMNPALAGGFFFTSAAWEALIGICHQIVTLVDYCANVKLRWPVFFPSFLLCICFPYMLT